MTVINNCYYPKAVQVELSSPTTGYIIYKEKIKGPIIIEKTTEGITVKFENGKVFNSKDRYDNAVIKKVKEELKNAH